MIQFILYVCYGLFVFCFLKMIESILFPLGYARWKRERRDRLQESARTTKCHIIRPVITDGAICLETVWVWAFVGDGDGWDNGEQQIGRKTKFKGLWWTVVSATVLTVKLQTTLLRFWPKRKA